jgi:hypothetical protein
MTKLLFEKIYAEAFIEVTLKKQTNDLRFQIYLSK